MVRDKSGKFVKGHENVSPGRPKREREEIYYRILMTACSADDWALIIDKAVKQAKAGDATARKWLADYLIGPPVERKEITGADGNAVVLTVVYDK
jgi:hypothetical protein